MKNVLILFIVGMIFFGSCKRKISENERYRPIIHFTPPSGWMNDPNGLVYLDGEYHLFYQYNPDTIVWGPMHWGHAVSADLIHWQHLPIALFPDSLGTIFSGSCVYDENNTSGLGTKEYPPLVAIFTHDGGLINRPEREGLQEQSLAFSTDKGRTWKKYVGNPVLHSMNKNFRDPKVIWHTQIQKWVMTLAAGEKIMFFNSPDLKIWKFGGTFTLSDTTLGTYECPDLFPIAVQGKPKDTKWVLLTSYTSGTPNGSCGTSYLVGDFDGNTFTCNDTRPGWFDYGADNYAGGTFSNIPSTDGRCIMIGWMSNWAYADKIPATTWRGTMTLPRELSLTFKDGKYQINSFPVKELKAFFTDSVSYSLDGLNQSVRLPENGCCAIDIHIDSAFDSLKIELSNNNNEMVCLTLKSQKLTINRAKSGKAKVTDFFNKEQSMPLPKTFPLKLHLVYDIATLELFANNGAVSMAEMVYPGTAYTRLQLNNLGKKKLFGTITINKIRLK